MRFERPLDARLTLLDSAQVFHWKETGVNSFEGAAQGHVLRVFTDAVGHWQAEGAEEDFLRFYFDEDRDYQAIFAEYAAFPELTEAFQKLSGLRVLNQPTWETLVTFILSANNNTKRIRSLVLRVMEHCGKGLFPVPEEIARCTDEELRALGMGYRAPYLAESARMVKDGYDLDALREMDYETAHRELLAFPGVGDKVADCVLLFGCGFADAYPVDVWVRRASEKVFGLRDKSAKTIQKKARELLGPHAGIAQQYLFHYARCFAE